MGVGSGLSSYETGFRCPVSSRSLPGRGRESARRVRGAKASHWSAGAGWLRQMPATGGRCPLSPVQYPMSNVQGPVSNVQCPMSNVQCPMSNVQCPVSGVRCPGMDVRWRGMVIGCLNSGVGAGFGAAGKAVAASNSGILPPSPRTLQELFSLPLVLISDSFPGMGTFRVLTAAEQVGEYLRAELCRGAW